MAEERTSIKLEQKVCDFNDCAYPDGKMESFTVLLLHPVSDTSGQTHTMLSITCTCSDATISHITSAGLCFVSFCM